IKLSDVGKNAAMNLANGMKSVTPALVNQAKEIAKAVNQALYASLINTSAAMPELSKASATKSASINASLGSLKTDLEAKLQAER
ncbi:hypothetical protein ABLW17_10495, partial [Anaerococcus murdochii]|uniref:hypothetical protein n=1 Tax=Anaerococcus murdochii TaxID=411577 RepID=UPI0032B485E7